MIRIAALAVASLLAAGCGGGGGGGHATSARPPRATITTAAGTHVLTTGSYCWTTRTGSSAASQCADAGAPATFPGLASVRVRQGETVLIQLGFTPTHPVEVSIAGSHLRLAAAATLRLRIRRPGLLTIDPRRDSDDVEYVARLITTPLPAGSS